MQTVKLRFDLFRLKQRLALQVGREYTWAYIARMCNLNIRTVMGLAEGNGSTRVDVATLEKLLGFFRVEGLPVTLCDLLIETAPPEDAGEVLSE